MTEPELTPSEEKSEPKERVAHAFRSLRELVDYVAGKSLPPLTSEEGTVTEPVPFPFLAIVGQQEMKLALLLGLINPNVGGIIDGPRQTTAVRSLPPVPQVERTPVSGVLEVSK
jgi:magnesium chelatase subunit I